MYYINQIKIFNMKHKELIINFILPILIIFIIFFLKLKWIVIYDYYINSWIIAIISILWIYTYLKSFSKIRNIFASLAIITFSTMFIHLNITFILSELNFTHQFGFVQFVIILWITTIWAIKILEGNKYLSYKNIIKIFLSYILTMVCIWHFLLSLWINWIYLKDLKKLETKCIDEICIDIYLSEHKYNYLNIYCYKLNNSIIKYNWKNPHIWIWDKYHQEKIKLMEDIVETSILNIENWNYILNYTDFEWEKKSLIINK